ncbi:Gram-negative bacterial tonB protein [compost metagenome]
MSNYLWYIFEVNVLMTILFIVFKLLQRYLSFGWQRFSLLSVPLLSIAVVWFKQESTVSESSWSYHIPVIRLETVEIHRQGAVPAVADLPWLEMFYWLGVGVLFTWMLFNLYKILRVFLGAKRVKKEGFSLVETVDGEPSSFFRFIQLPSGLSQPDHDLIFQHEKIHARKLHSADRLFFEAVHCLSWFNPALLLMKKELIHIHEFEVDRIMYTQYRVGYMEFLLAYSLGTSSTSYLFTNQFVTKLTLIKRIKTMKNTSKKVLVAALALPLIAGGLTMISFTSEGENIPQRKVENTRPVTKRAPQKDAESPRKIQAVSGTEKKIEAEKVPSEKEIQVLKFEPPFEEMPEITTKEMKSKTLPQEKTVDKLPEYTGGSEAMTKYMIENVRYPETAVKSKTTGKVIVSFVVTKTGKVTKASVKKGVSKELDEEALRVVSAMPDWIPAEKDDKKVDAEMVLPVMFKL